MTDYNDPKLITAYKDGINAAYRIGKYKDCKDVPDNPYQENSPEAEAWDNGFMDGTEDYINAKRHGY